MHEQYQVSDRIYPTNKLGKLSILDMLHRFQKEGVMRISDLHIKIGAVPAYRIDGDLVKVDGRLFRVWTAKVKVPRVQRKKLRLLISQQDLIDKKTKERSWSDFKYILTTDLSMGSWLIIYLYRRRWKIETFYKFAKNCLKFAASRLESEQSITRFFIMLYFAYTYLALTRDPNCIYYEDSKSLYEAKNLLEERSFEEVIEWIYDKSIQGVDLDEIKAHFEV